MRATDLRTPVLLLVTLCAGAPAGAEEAKGAPPGGGAQGRPAEQAPNLDELFGDSLGGGSSMQDLKDATQGIGSKTTSDGLKPKTDVHDPNAKVSFLGAFAAERIVVTKKEGCIPAGRERKKVVTIELNQLPSKGPVFSTCVSMESTVGRQMHLAASIVDARNRRVAKAEGVADFAGRPKLDYVLDFPAVPFQLAGPYQLVVDLDGKPAARLPLFDVKLVD